MYPMNNPPRILVVDDNAANRDILSKRLISNGYQVLEAGDGEQALATAREYLPDLILLDVMMPKLDGLGVCRALGADRALPFMPIILVTAKSDPKDIILGLEAGAAEYLTKPVDQAALVARVRSVLRIKALHDQVEAQAAQLAAWNLTLEHRVAEQRADLERLGRLKRFLAPQVANLIISTGEQVLESHRRNVTVVFCDLRDFTPFSERAEPEEQIAMLGEYHSCLGALINKWQGTLLQIVGDGIMVVFNDPVPCAEPAKTAVRMAVEMRTSVGKLMANWQSKDYGLGFGIGIAQGYATLGRIGSEDRSQYAAIGTVTNLAARLCGEAANGQILIDTKVRADLESIGQIEDVGNLALKGFSRSIHAFNVIGLE
jgi:class 3 adenylate cyclase